MSSGILMAMPIGLAFGTFAHLSGVSSPQTIRAQFIFEKEIMMKMFLGGLSGSALSLAILSVYDTHAFDKAREGRGFGDKGAVSAVLGGLIQGAGMALAGSCPGMAFAQMGAGVPSAPMTYLGGLAGASLYHYLHPWLKDHHVFDFASTLEGRVESMHLERVFFGGKFAPIAMGFSALTMAAALTFEAYFPWRTEIIAIRQVDSNYAINPTAAGFLMGSLQIPMYMALGTFLGCSSGYSVATAQVLRLIPEEFLVQYTYAKNFVNSKASWQVGLGAGIVAGAAIASGFAKSVFDAVVNGASFNPASVPHVPNAQAFFGGLMIVFGARFVGGCASGHGLSGLPSLHVVSWLTIPSMFAGGILTGMVMSHYGMPMNEYLLK